MAPHRVADALRSRCSTMSTASNMTAPHAPARCCIEAWFSHFCFAELVVEVRHRGGNTLHGVVVRGLAARAFRLGDSVGGERWCGDHRGQSKNHGDCAGEHQSSRRDLNGCHSHTLSSPRQPRRAAGTQDLKGSLVRTPPTGLSRHISKRSQPVVSLVDCCQFTWWSPSGSTGFNAHSRRVVRRTAAGPSRAVQCFAIGGRRPPRRKFGRARWCVRRRRDRGRRRARRGLGGSEGMPVGAATGWFGDPLPVGGLDELPLVHVVSLWLRRTRIRLEIVAVVKGIRRMGVLGLISLTTSGLFSRRSTVRFL